MLVIFLQKNVMLRSMFNDKFDCDNKMLVLNLNKTWLVELKLIYGKLRSPNSMSKSWLFNITSVDAQTCKSVFPDDFLYCKIVIKY